MSKQPQRRKTTGEVLNAWSDDSTASSMDIAFTAAIRKELVVEVKYFEFATEVEFNLAFPLTWFYIGGATLESEIPIPLEESLNLLIDFMRLNQPIQKRLDYKELSYLLNIFNEQLNQDLAKIVFMTHEV